MKVIKQVRHYRDLSMVFQPHPSTHDAITKIDAASIKQSIRNLVMTMHYERPFHPEKGCQVYGLLFENVNMITLQIAKQCILDVLTQYEPRATIVDIVFDNQLSINGINITISFKIINTQSVETVSVFVNRIR